MSTVVGRIAALVREPSGRPSERAVAFWAWDAAVGWTIFAGLQLLWMLLADAWTQPLHLAGLALTVLAAIVHVTVMPRWRYRVHRWEITEDAIGVEAVVSPEGSRITAPMRNPDTVTDLFVTFREAGIHLTEMSVQKPTLDEVFLTLTGHGVDDATDSADTTASERVSA